MDKLDMMSRDGVQVNIEKIRELFPNCVTEVLRDGNVTLAVDFDILRQEMSDTLIDDKEERYQFTWPDKKASIRLANKPINKTLRPCREESVNFDTTENLYIEGDNLEVLKLLQETYHGKVKMIYIDPPYNTGSDFIYEDDYSMSADEYMDNSGQYDAEGNRMVQNLESNGRFHTDWLNMIYPRLKLAKDLLADDGVIFISIDDNEEGNLRKACDEIFGNVNYIATFNRVTKKSSNNGNNFSPCIDYTLIYAKSINYVPEYKIPLSQEIIERYNKKDEYEIERGKYQEVGLFMSSLKHGGSNYLIECPDGQKVYPPNGQPWRWNEKTFLQGKKEGRIVFKKSKNSPLLVEGTGEQASWNIYTKVYLKERAESGIHPKNYSDQFQNTLASNELNRLGIPFDFAKPIELVAFFVNLQANSDAIILDFFSGSATTAHAVMQLNAEDGGKRKFIMVQLPEVCDEKSEAYKAGYKNICEIGKERIRRAGKKLQEELREDGCGFRERAKGMLTKEIKTSIGTKTMQYKAYDLPRDYEEQNKKMAEDFDIGFRVLKVDESNMKDVYYTTDKYNKSLLDSLEDNIKEDRTPLDLLFQVMLDLGVTLSSSIEETEIAGMKVYNVAGNYLLASFDNDLTEEVITTIAQQKPVYFVMRDSSMANDSVSTNFDQIFKTYSPDTIRKVL